MKFEIRLTEIVALILVVAGIVAYFARAAYGWNIPAESLIASGIGLLAGKYVGVYLEKRYERKRD